MNQTRLPLYALLLAMGFAAAPSLAADAVTPQQELHWVRHVCPLPREIRISGSVSVPAGSVSVMAGTDDPLTRQAVGRLVKAVGSPVGPASFTITLNTGGPDCEPLKHVSNSDQAYRIVPAHGDRGIRLAALSPRGLFYAASTLAQLMSAGPKGSSLTIPLADVTDWPEIEDRGLWGADTHVRLKWMGERKLNVVEQISYLIVDKEGKGHAALKPGREPMVDEGPLLGIKPIPSILHLDQIGGKGLFDAYPELRGQGGEENAICYSKSEGIVSVLADWMSDLKSVRNVEEVDCWLSENLHGKGGCKCAECAKEDRSLKEARVVLEAWKRARQRVGPFGLRMMTSEETGRSNRLIMDELPEGVKLWYYHSLFTYTSAHVPMIPPDVAAYAAKGKWAGVVPSLCSWVNFVSPFSGAAFVRYRMNEFADRKLSGVLAYPSPGISYTRFNTEAAAEWSWNPKGRSTQEFAHSWAVREGLKDPEKFAELSEALGQAGWDVYASEWPACEKRRFPGQVSLLLRKGELPELGSSLHDAFRGPWGAIKTPEQQDRDVEAARTAVRLAAELGISEFVQESLAVDGYIRSLKALYELKSIVGRDGVAAGREADAERWFSAYIAAMEQAAKALPEWDKEVSGKGTAQVVEPTLDLVNRSARQMRELASDLKLNMK